MLELDARRNVPETGGLVFAALPRVEGTLGRISDEVRAPTAEVRGAVGGAAAFPAAFPAADDRPEVEPTGVRAPCLRLTCRRGQRELSDPVTKDRSSPIQVLVASIPVRY